MKLEMTKITKSFGPNKVLDNVDLKIGSQEIHALIGENGAGKSTLMKILTGIYSMDSGEIIVNDQKVNISNIQDSEKYGIAIVNQELALFNEMTVLENLFMTKEHTIAGGFINTRQQMIQAKEIFEKLNIKLNPHTRVGDLSVGMQQMLEIAKSLVNDAKLVIMDEPTSALTEKEIEALFRVIRKLKENGKSVIYISHRLKEIFELCDGITILRDGKKIIESRVTDMSFDDVVRNMVGYEMGDMFPERFINQKGKQLLRVEKLTKKGQFNDINFDLFEGEIVGIAGLMGSGRTELMNVIFGAIKQDHGNIYLHGKLQATHSIVNSKINGLGYVTENRKEEGLFLDFSIKDNILMNNLLRFSRYFFVDQMQVSKNTINYAEKTKLKYRNIHQYVNELSGGNQQKVVLSKWLLNNPSVLILDEPTRGIDVNAKKQIYEMIFELKRQGIGIIVVSSELVELLGISDRILVMREGYLKKELLNDQISDETIMKYMMRN